MLGRIGFAHAEIRAEWCEEFVAKLQDEESSQALKAKTFAIARVFHWAILCPRHMFETSGFIAETVFPLDLLWFSAYFAEHLVEQHVVIRSQALAGGQCQNQVSIFCRGETEPLQALPLSVKQEWENSYKLLEPVRLSGIKEWSFQCRSGVKPQVQIRVRLSEASQKELVESFTELKTEVVKLVDSMTQAEWCANMHQHFHLICAHGLHFA